MRKIILAMIVLSGLVVGGWELFTMLAVQADSDASCTAVYTECCGSSPMAVNKQFAGIFETDSCMCPAVLETSDYINHFAVEKDGTCVLRKKLDSACRPDADRHNDNYCQDAASQIGIYQECEAKVSAIAQHCGSSNASRWTDTVEPQSVFNLSYQGVEYDCRQFSYRKNYVGVKRLNTTSCEPFRQQ